MRLVLLILVLFFLGCEKKEKIPVVMGFNSNYSSIAKGLKNGILLAQEDSSIQFNFIDNKGDKKLTREIDTKLIEKKTPLIIGHITSSITKAVVPIFTNTNTILFSPTASTKDLAGIDDNFIRIQPIKDYESIKNVLKYMYKLGIKKINIIYDKTNKSYSKSLINSFLDKRNKYVKVSKIIPICDFKIAKINSKIPLFIIASTVVSVKIIKKIKKKGFRSLIFLSGSAFTKDFIKLAGDDGDGILFFSTFNPSSEDKKYLKFKEKFIAKFGYEPGSFEVKGYEIAKISSKIIREDNIKKALINHTFDGLQGKIYINKYGDTIRDTHIYILNNLVFEKVE